ncbi:peptidoglycan-binding protein [Magnetospirillum aberrantis]|uniref:Peptidoglycan binding-like domain-containing protein n=1 Tax=Magnetospirillum aberrantis SpK TaxID=908842 RepID=A0A7C9UYE7_9PROT|nr:peptidoglycan-binding protein [Magnetospirillum aberrantis]NFV81949.1 hypothetical protein [Magnetospirillum aberrantis SpK]
MTSDSRLSPSGYYKPLTNDGPNGWHNSNLDQAIRSFQKDKGLEVDGFLKPGGPTIGKIGSLLGGSGPQGSAKPSDPWEVKVGGRNPGDSNTLKPPAWWQAIGDGDGDGDGDGEDPEPFPGQPRLPSPVPPGGEPVPPAGLGVNHFVEHRPTQEQMDQYQAEYKKWVQDNWDAIQKNQELKRQGLPTIPLPPPPRNPREGIPGVLYAVDPAGATSSPAGKPDPFPNHTINQNGIDGNQAYAEMLGRDSDPSQTARMLKRAIDDYGDQGRGDVADLLARFQKIDGTKAEDLRRELHKATGEILPYRLAPLGEGFREPTDEEKIAAAPKTPFGSAQGADRWAAGTMADALLGKGDYADAITHFQGEIGRNRAEAMPYLAAVHEIMGEKNPGLAAKFATQMQKAGLAAEAEKKPETAPKPVPAPTPAPASVPTSAPAVPPASPPSASAPVSKPDPEKKPGTKEGNPGGLGGAVGIAAGQTDMPTVPKNGGIAGGGKSGKVTSRASKVLRDVTGGARANILKPITRTLSV